MDLKKVWKVLKTALKILITGGLLYYVFQKIDLEEVRGVYQQSNPIFLIPAIVAFFCSQVVSSSRLLGFFRAKGLRLPFIFNLKLYFLGMFYNLFLPGGIGGDGYKVYLLRSRYSFPVKKSIGVLFIDRLSGLWALTFIAGLLLISLPEIDFPPAVLITAFLAGSVAYLFLLHKLFGVGLSTATSGHLKALVVQALQLVSVAMLLLALNFQGRFSPYLATFLVSSLVAIFPFTVGGLGAREYVFVLAAGILVMDKNVAVSLSLSFYLISALVASGGAYFVLRGKEFAPIQDMKEAAALREKEESMTPVRQP